MMQRNLEALARGVYDLLVIGGGINGVSIARDAALRGLSVALVEKGDFGHATSFNSLKVIHGGLRYLQHLDIRRMRESIYERMILMRIAPHLVHPLPFLMPTCKHSLYGKGIMTLVMLMNDLIGIDRNRLQDPKKHLPRGRTIAKREYLQLVPGINQDHLTGGAIWYDAQIYNSERLLLACLHSAVCSGAQVANYVGVTGPLTHGNKLIGVKARDQLTQHEIEIQAKVIVNASGPWSGHTAGLLKGSIGHQKLFLSKAMNLVTDRLLDSEYAVGVFSKKGYSDSKAFFNKGNRLFFIVPWRKYSLIGTAHIPFWETPDTFSITENEIEDFIAEINESYSALGLTRQNVRFIYGGLLPMHEPKDETQDVSLTKRFQICDHHKEDNIEGLISVVGVKYTEARNVAEKVVDLVGAKLGRNLPSSRTAFTPVYGGNIEQFENFLGQEITTMPNGLKAEVTRHLIHNYGTAYLRILRYLDQSPEWGAVLPCETPVLMAEVLHAIREEMAVKLTDVVLRRTELGLHGSPGDQCLQLCANIMGKELGWSKHKMLKEIQETRMALAW